MCGCSSREWWQREQLFERGLQVEGSEAQRGDLFIMGDVDEIPRPAALRALRHCDFDVRHNCATLESDMFYYSYSWYTGVWKAGPKVGLLSPLSRLPLDFLSHPVAAVCQLDGLLVRKERDRVHSCWKQGPLSRSSDAMSACTYSWWTQEGWHLQLQVIPYNGRDTMDGMDKDAARWESECSLSLPKTATHCSSCFGSIADFQNKMASFAHWQLNTKHYTDPALVVGRVTQGISLLGTSMHACPALPCLLLHQ